MNDIYHDAGHRLRIHDKRIRLHQGEANPSLALKHGRPYTMHEEIPQEVIQAATTLKNYMAMHNLKSLFGFNNPKQ